MLGPFYVNTEARRISAWGQPCKIPWGTTTLMGKNFRVHRDTIPAWEALEQVRKEFGYTPTGTDTGFYNCRHMRHDPKLPWSAHAWATALDWNWLQNPAGSKLVTDMPKSMIRKLQSLQTNSGAWVFMWGGDWDRDPATSHSYYDAMHWEVIAHPLDLATGIKSIDLPGGTNDMLTQGDRSGAVKALQTHLNDWQPAFKLVEDGIFGAGTAAAVRDYQSAAGLEVTGDADPLTFALVATNAFRNPKTLANIIDGGT